MIECEENGYNGLSVKRENERHVPEEYYYLFTGAPRVAKKTTTVSRLARSYYNAGYKILVFTDVKDTMDYAHCQFPPEEKWHLKKLKEQGEKPKIIPCEVYHPFTFSIPTKKIPKTKFYTMSLKSLDGSDVEFLGGFKGDISKNIILNNARRIKNTEGFYHFIHNVNESVKEQFKYVGKKRVYYPDDDNFLVQTSSVGDRGNLKEISGMFKIFGERYDDVPLFMQHNFELNLDWKQILSNQEEYTVFSSRYIPKNREKLKKYLIFKLLKDFFNNFNQYAKYPVLIIIEEIRNFMPQKPFGYDKVIEQELRNNISAIGGQGKGIAIITTTQVYTDVSQEVLDSFNKRYVGNMAGAVNDFKRLSMSLGWDSDKRQSVQELQSGEWLQLGKENEIAFKSLVPEHALQSRFVKYDALFKKYYPDEMESYKELVKKMEVIIKSEREEVKKSIMKKIKKKEKFYKKQELEKMKKSEQKEHLEKMKQEKKEQKWEDMKKRDKKIIEQMIKQDASDRELARIVKDELNLNSLTHPTVALVRTIWDCINEDPQEATITTIIGKVQKTKKAYENFKNYIQVENIIKIYQEFYPK